MPRRTATIGSLPEAFGMVKAMRADGPDRGTDCRQAARQALAGIIQGGMAEDVDRWLDGPEGHGGGDRRNGTYPRRLLCGLGDIELEVPRTRRYCPRRPSTTHSASITHREGPEGPLSGLAQSAPM